jgi:transcriptional regulator with XRE-family HTH domain
MAVTLEDVAQQAGVSHTTVSLVLKGNQKISAKTRDKVLKVIQIIMLNLLQREKQIPLPSCLLTTLHFLLWILLPVLKMRPGIQSMI